MGVMVVSVPLPGYVARLLNDVQTERMKRVCGALPLVDIFIEQQTSYTDGCARAVCHGE